MSLVRQKRLKTPRKTTVIFINQIWQELCKVQSGAGIEIHELANTLSIKHSSLTKDAWSLKLQDACDDGLVTYWTGRNYATMLGLPGLEVNERNLADRDWYCFICHQEGQVIRCNSCPKSFHPKCLPIGLQVATFGVMDKSCIDCTLINVKNSMVDIPNARTLNQILSLLLKEIVDWNIPMLMNVDVWPQMMFGEHAMMWRYAYLLYAPIDVTKMYTKALGEGYLCLEEFQKDCKTLLHNIGIFFGQLMLDRPSVGDKFLRKVHDEMRQVHLCYECFLRWKKKDEDEWWFCRPCNVRHEVVWANAPGMPTLYWPAKVMDRRDGFYWLALFGSSNFWKRLPESRVHPITAQVNDEGMTPEWRWAVEKLKMYQTLNPAE